MSLAKAKSLVGATSTTAKLFSVAASNITVLTPKTGMHRISFYVDLSDTATCDLIFDMQYTRNRKLSPKNQTLMEQENEKGRLLSTNVVAFATNAQGECHQVNAHHTNNLFRDMNADGMDIPEPIYHVVIWLEPDDWASRDNEYLNFIDTMYTRYDAGKSKSIADQYNALDAAGLLGLHKTNVGLFNSIITSIAYDGSKGTSSVGSDRNADKLQTAASLLSPIERLGRKQNYLEDFTAYLFAQALLPTKSAFGQHKLMRKTMRNASIASAYVRARHALAEKGCDDDVDRIDDFLCEFAQNTTPSPDSNFAALLQMADRNNDQSMIKKMAASSANRPTHACMLAALAATIQGKTLSLNELNCFATGVDENGDVLKPEGTLRMSFGDLDFDIPYYRHGTKKSVKMIESLGTVI